MQADDHKTVFGEIALFYKLAEAFAIAGWTHDDVLSFADRPLAVRDTLLVLRGKLVFRDKFIARFPLTHVVYKSSDAYRASMAAKGYGVGDNVVGMLERVDWAQGMETEEDEEVVFVSDRELGMSEAYTIGELMDAAAGFGLRRFNANVAVGLREQYRHQLVGNEVLCAMDPIEDSFGVRCLFSLVSKDVKSLESHIVRIGDTFLIGWVWAFSRRKSQHAQG